MSAVDQAAPRELRGDRRAGMRRRAEDLQQRGIFVVLLALVLVSCVVVDRFASVENFSDILRSVSLIGIVAVGMTFVVISGNFVDLSVPAQITAVTLLVLALQDSGLGLAIAAGLGAALCIGLANGLLVGGMGGNAVLVTLAIQTVAAGAVLAISGGANEYGQSSAFRDFGQSAVGPVPVQAIFFLALAALAHVVLYSSRFGFELYAVGSNRDAARVAGVRVKRLVASTFILSAALVGIAGVLLAAYTNSGNSSSGVGYEFDALTAVVVGGTSLFGGIGSVARTVAGVLFIGVVNNVMILAGLPFETQYLVKGGLVILAVSLDTWVQRRGALA